MTLRFAVLLHRDLPSGGRPVQSGYLLAGDQILTTWHGLVESDRNGTIKVQQGHREVRVATIAHIFPELDVAILKLSGRHCLLDPGACTADWLDNVPRGIDVIAYGYPFVLTKPYGKYQLLNFRGYLEPGTAREQAHVRLEVARTQLADGTSELQGTSGGPVFDADERFLVGIVTAAHRDIIYFRPTAHLLEHEMFRAALARTPRSVTMSPRSSGMLKSLPELFDDEVLACPNHPHRSFRQALEHGDLFHRPVLAALIDCLALERSDEASVPEGSETSFTGSAVVVGPLGSGKTTLALHAAHELGLMPYYFGCRGEEHGISEFLKIMDADEDSILIIDDVHNSHVFGNRLWDQWVERRQRRAGFRCRLLFCSESTAHTRRNIFHTQSRTLSTSMSQAELRDYLRFSCQRHDNDSRLSLGEAQAREIHGAVGSLFLLAVAAVEELLERPDGRFKQKGDVAGALVRRRLQEDGFERRAILQAHGLPANQGPPISPAMAAIVARRASTRGVVDVLVTWWEGHDPPARAHASAELLRGAAASGSAKVLRAVINALFDRGLRDHSSMSLADHAVMLRALRQYDQEEARKLSHVRSRSGPPPPFSMIYASRSEGWEPLVAYLDEYLRLNRWTLYERFEPEQRDASDYVYAFYRWLLERFQREKPGFIVLVRVTMALARSSPAMARRWFLEAREHAVPVEDHLELSWLVGGLLRRLPEVASEVGEIATLSRDALYQRLLDMRHPSLVYTHLRCVVAFKRRMALDVVKALLESEEFDGWLKRLFQRPTHLYEIGNIIGLIRRLSPIHAIRLISRAMPLLMDAALREHRISSLCSLLAMLHRLSPRQARIFLGTITSRGMLERCASIEYSGFRLGLSLKTLGRVEPRLVAKVLAHVDDARLSEMLMLAASAGEALVLLDGTLVDSRLVDTATAKHTLTRILDAGANEQLLAQKLLEHGLGPEDAQRLAHLVVGIRSIDVELAARLLAMVPLHELVDLLDTSVTQPAQFIQALRGLLILYPKEGTRMARERLENPSFVELLVRHSFNGGLATFQHVVDALGNLDTDLAKSFIDISLVKLADRKASLLESALRRERNTATRGAALEAMARHAPEVARKALTTVLRWDCEFCDLRQSIDLRQGVAVVRTIRKVDAERYQKHVVDYITRDARRYEEYDQYVSLLVREEVNADVIGSALKTFVTIAHPKLKKNLARAVVGILLEWSESSVLGDVLTDNLPTQSISFAAAWVYVQSRLGTPAMQRITSSYFNPGAIAKHFGMVSSVRSLSLSIRDVERMSRSCSDRRYLCDVVGKLSHERVSELAGGTLDCAGLGLLHAQLKRLSNTFTDPRTHSECLGAIQSRIVEIERSSLQRSSFDRVLALAMLARDTSSMKDGLQRMVDDEPRAERKLWKIGFIDWLYRLASKQAGREYQPPYRGLRTDAMTKSQKSRSIGSNIAFSFATAWLREFGPIPGLDEEIERRVRHCSDEPGRKMLKGLRQLNDAESAALLVKSMLELCPWPEHEVSRRGPRTQ